MIEIYRAACENVKVLKQQAKSIKRMLNRALANHRWDEVNTLTKTYALLYSAYAEVTFLKMIHTPYGFSDSYIKEIQKQRNLEEKWEKCFELVFAAILTDNNKGSISNQKLKLERILKEYIIKPSQIRNKIAHGQWKICLNSESTAVNSDTTALVADLDYVRIDILFNVYDIFARCIEDLIESPKRAHFEYFYSNCVELEEYLEATKSYTKESKLQVLQESPKIQNKPKIETRGH